MLYPNLINELFCMSVAECCGVGTVPVTSARGALSERVENNQTGFLISGKPGNIAYNRKFVEKAVFLLRNKKERESMGKKCCNSAMAYQKNAVASEIEQKIINILRR